MRFRLASYFSTSLMKYFTNYFNCLDYPLPTVRKERGLVGLRGPAVRDAGRSTSLRRYKILRKILLAYCQTYTLIYTLAFN